MTDDLPDKLEPDRHLHVSSSGTAARRIVMALFAVIAVLALLNVFGQDATSSRASGERGQLEVSVPPHLRGGLFYQGKIVVRALSAIERPVVQLREGWIEEIQANTVAPAPESESSDADSWSLEYDSLAAGETLTIWMQFEVNPLGAGRRDQSVRLLDGEEPLASVSRRLTVFP
jgi:hypothetical protein